MTSKWKWLVGIAATVILGALGSGLWSVCFAPLGSLLIKGILSLVTLGISSARDSVYASAAHGYSERPSVLLLSFFGATILMTPLAFVAFAILLPRRVQQLTGLSRSEVERRMARVRRLIHILLPILALLSSVLFVRILLTAYTNTVISRFHQSLAIATPYISVHEHDEFLARFAKVRKREDFLALFANLDAILAANGEARSDFSPW
jgi:hypothetical protein